MRKSASIAGLALLLAAVLLLLASVTRIPAGSVGVAGADEDLRVLEPGLHFRRPFSDSPSIYPLILGPQSGEIRVRTRDAGPLPLRFEIGGTLDPSRADALHRASTDRTLPELLQWVGGEAVARAAADATALELARGDLTRAAERLAGELFAPAGLSRVTLSLTADSPEALLELARALAPSERSPLLRERIQRSLEGEGAGDWRSFTAMGLVLESEGRPREAEHHYLDALAMEPAALPPMAQLYRIYTAVGEEDRLLRLLGAALQADPSSVQHLIWGTAVHMKKGEYGRAIESARRAVALEPENVRLLNNLGGTYLKSGDMEAAIRTFREALEKAPSDRGSLYNLAAALAAAGNDRESLTYLLAAERTGDAGRPLLEAIAAAYRRLGESGKAADYAARAKKAADAAIPAPPREGL